MIRMCLLRTGRRWRMYHGPSPRNRACRVAQAVADSRPFRTDRRVQAVRYRRSRATVADRGATNSARTRPETTGAGTLLIYTAITGHTPFDLDEESPVRPLVPNGGPNLEGGALDQEIEEELKRRQEALDQLERRHRPVPCLDRFADYWRAPRRARQPRASHHALRPTAVSRRVHWQSNPSRSWPAVGIIRSKRSRSTAALQDDNGDGVAGADRCIFQSDNAIRCYAIRGGRADGDGQVDTWQNVRRRRALKHQRSRDTNADGAIDVWEEYRRRDEMTGRTLDRDRNGVVDSFLRIPWRCVGRRTPRWRQRRPDRSSSFATKNLFRTQQRDRSRPRRCHRHVDHLRHRSRRRGGRTHRTFESEARAPPDIFETFDTTSGKSILAKREEDRDGDGSHRRDVSLPKDGKLVQREVTGSEAQPL